MNAILLYSFSRARMYAVHYCAAGNDCPDGQFSGITGGVVNTDCTHFMSHVLKAGGVTVPGIGLAQCKSGLCFRVTDLEGWFANGTTKYGNLKRIQWTQAGNGDFVFLEGFRWRDFAFGITHVMMVAGPVSKDGSLVFGHSNERCGNEKIDYDPDSTGRFYRIESLDGLWTSNDSTKRFVLTLDGANPIAMTEQRGTGTSILRRSISPTLQPDGRILLSRPIDDEILKLDFPNAALRAEILSHSPPASTLLLTEANDGILGEWTGLLIRKNPNGTFKEIISPTQVPIKQFNFIKT